MCSRIQEILIYKCKISKTKIGFDSNIYRLYITKGKIDVLKYMYYPLLNKDIVLDRKYQTAKRLILDSIKVNKCRPTPKVAWRRGTKKPELSGEPVKIFREK